MLFFDGLSTISSYKLDEEHDYNQSICRCISLKAPLSFLISNLNLFLISDLSLWLGNIPNELMWRHTDQLGLNK